MNDIAAFLLSLPVLVVDLVHLAWKYPFAAFGVAAIALSVWTIGGILIHFRREERRARRRNRARYDV